MSGNSWDVSIVVEGPVLTKSSAIGAPGFDAVMARGTFEEKDGKAKRFLLPAALVKGLLREAWQELTVADERYSDWVERWLGRGSNDEDNSPQRGILRFTDFVDERRDAESPQSRRFRIQVDDLRGAAEGQMLQMMESPYGPGEEIEFRGRVRTNREEPGMAEAILRGLLWIRATGGNRSIGFGQVLRANVSKATEVRPTPQPAPSEGRWRLQLSFTQPVMFSKRRIAENFFESGEIIPGAALTGAIAETIGGKQGFDELRSELSLVRFTHAFPTAAGGLRPTQVPLSLVRVGDSPAMDVIHRKTPPVGKLVRFRIDWKDSEIEEVRKQAGWPVALGRDLRVRTAISSELRKAKDQKLFAWQAIDPYGHEWVATADVSSLSAAARAQLAEILACGVEPLGKTKARGKVELQGINAPTVDRQKSYVVTLQSPVLLIEPDRIKAERGSEAEALRCEYERAWQDICRALRLVNYFGACSLAGGDYFHRRFQGRGEYKPYLLTEAGTTFLLEAVEGREEEGRAALERLVRSGLPLRKVLCGHYGVPERTSEQWSYCPYTPGNGYGEIAVNGQQIWPEA